MSLNAPQISILLIEDDIQLGDVVKSFLETFDMTVTHAKTAEQGLEFFDTKPFDCVLLDLTLPDEDGLVVLRKLVSKSDTPVIVCSGRGNVEDRITGFEFGASDYVPKPYSVKELVLRIQALARRSTKHQNKLKTIHHYSIDDEAKVLIDNNNQQRISLTHKEFSVLAAMANHPGRVYTRGELIDATAGIDGPDSERAMDVMINRLRKKIEDNPKSPKIVKTAIGFGYYLEINVQGSNIH